MCRFIRSAIEEVEVVGAFDEGDVGFVYNGRPLEWCTCTILSAHQTRLFEP
jgi:hypothetical protein